MRKLVAVILLGALLSACGKPEIDASSEESYKSSLKEMNSELSPEMQESLSKALTKLAFQKFMGGAQSGTDKVTAFRSSVDGKTAEELIAESGDKAAE